MSIKLYAAKIVAEVLNDRRSLEMAYRAFPDSNLYFMMVDLVQSTNYRLANGPEMGYIRGESFFSLVKSTLRPYAQVRLFKEMGDAALVCAPDLRPLFEAAILMDQATRQLSFADDDLALPFAVRLGADFGIAKKLTRRDEDYLGEVIDRLARLMTVRSPTSNFVLGERAFDINKGVLQEYSSLCEISGPLSLNLPAAKAVSEPVVYREVRFVEKNGKPFTDHFEQWRRSS
jgi:hypothetical protein